MALGPTPPGPARRPQLFALVEALLVTGDGPGATAVAKEPSAWPDEPRKRCKVVPPGIRPGVRHGRPSCGPSPGGPLTGSPQLRRAPGPAVGPRSLDALVAGPCAGDRRPGWGAGVSLTAYGLATARTSRPMGQLCPGTQGCPVLLWASSNRADPGLPNPHDNGSWRAGSRWPQKGHPEMGYKTPFGGPVETAQGLGRSPGTRGLQGA